MNKPVIVCLCGSGRFKEAFDEAEYRETLAGKIVLTIGCNTHDIAREPELVQHKAMLDELHLRKIDLADEVLILNVKGYIGESTKREYYYAREHGKVIRYWEPMPPDLKPLPEIEWCFMMPRYNHTHHLTEKKGVLIKKLPGLFANIQCVGNKRKSRVPMQDIVYTGKYKRMIYNPFTGCYEFDEHYDHASADY